MSSTSLRALLVSKELAPYSPAGGIGTYTRILAGALAQADVDTHVLCVDPGLPRAAARMEGFTAHTAPLIQPRGVGRISRLPATWGRLTQAFSVWRAYRRLGLEFDVVEAPELYAEGLFIALFESVPLIVRMHSSAAQLFPYLDRGGIDFRATVALENAAIHRADIVASTRSNLDETAEELGLDPARTREIIYPVHLREVAPEQTGTPVVLFVGRLEPLKNPEVLVRAAPKVLAQQPTLRFRFVGTDTLGRDGRSHQTRLEEVAAQLGVDGAVEFVGAVEPAQVFDEMARAKVCAFPSRTERFGNVAAEAASIGRPVVVSDIPAFRDFVEDGRSGRLAAVDDEEQWAEALLDMVTDSARARSFALALREDIRRRADPSHVAELVIESYEAAIARRTADRGLFQRIQEPVE